MNCFRPCTISHEFEGRDELSETWQRFDGGEKLRYTCIIIFLCFHDAISCGPVGLRANCYIQTP